MTSQDSPGEIGVVASRRFPSQRMKLKFQDIFQDPVSILIHNFALFFLQSPPDSIRFRPTSTYPSWSVGKPDLLSCRFSSNFPSSSPSLLQALLAPVPGRASLDVQGRASAPRLAGGGGLCDPRWAVSSLREGVLPTVPLTKGPANGRCQ